MMLLDGVKVTGVLVDSGILMVGGYDIS